MLALGSLLISKITHPDPIFRQLSHTEQEPQIPFKMASHKSLFLTAIFLILAQSLMHTVAAAPAPSDAEHNVIVDHHRIYRGPLSTNGTFRGNGTFGGNGTFPGNGRHPPYCVCYICCMSKSCGSRNTTGRFSTTETEKVSYPLRDFRTSSAAMARTSNIDGVAMLATAIGLAWILMA